MIPFVGYAPDLPPETPGIFLDCDQIIPVSDGFVAQNAVVSSGDDALAGAARGFAVVEYLDDTRRVFAATRTKIYDLASGTWTDRSAVGDYDLGADAEVRARFVPFGAVTIASVGTANGLQVSTSGAFSLIADSPAAKVIEVVDQFVFAFDYVDGTHGLGTAQNGWWCCAQGDHTDWAPNVANQCVAGTFGGTPGRVVGARRLGSNMVAYKRRSAFIANYVGVPQVWNWTQLPGEVGAVSHESIVNVGTAHYLMGETDFYVFDGTRFEPIGAPVRATVFDEMDQQYVSLVCASHDKVNGIIYWHYPSRASSGTLDRCIAYNYKLNRWGRADVAIELAATYITPGVTIDGLDALYSTIDDIPTTVSFDSSFWLADYQYPIFFKTDHAIYLWSGAPGESSITSGHYGDIGGFSTVTRVRPRFLLTPESSTLEHFYSNGNADQMTVGATTVLIDNTYDLLWSARWHQVVLNFSGAMKITGFKPEFTVDGDA